MVGAAIAKTSGSYYIRNFETDDYLRLTRTPTGGYTIKVRGSKKSATVGAQVRDLDH